MGRDGLPASMFALRITRFGGPEVLEPARVPVPEPAAGEVLVAVRTVAANRQDTFTMSGRANIQQLVLPHIPGNDPAGVVVAVGTGVTELAVGDRVVAKPTIPCGSCEFCVTGEDAACARMTILGVHRPGGFAEFVTVPGHTAFRIPDPLGFAEATALAQSAPVALHLLRDRAGLTADDTVLVTGAAGALASAAIQLAKIAGATVIAGARGPERAAYASSIGADHVFDYAAEPAFGARVLDWAPNGVSVYVESAGDPAIWTEALSTLGRRARVGVVGSHAGPMVQLNLNWLFRSRVTIFGSSGSTLANFREVLELARAERLRPNIDSVTPLVEAPAAFERILARGNRGKIILEVAADSRTPA